MYMLSVDSYRPAKVYSLRNWIDGTQQVRPKSSMIFGIYSLGKRQSLESPFLN